MKLSRVGLGVVGIAALVPQPTEAQNANRPNIILIMTDQQRGDAMGCTSGGVVITPNIDALARDGVLFTSAYSSVPSSTPARAGLLTGCSPWQHGMIGYGNQAETYPCEMPSMLKEAGYAALAVGKMHYYPQQNTHGYDVVLFDESGRRTSPFFMSDYRKWFLSQHFGTNPDATGLSWNGHEGRAYTLPEELHPTRWTADRAVEMIEGYDSAKPLFLKVSFARPHSPYDPPQRLLDLYEGREVLPTAHGDWVPEEWLTPVDPAEADRDACICNLPEQYIARSRRHYYASVTFVDEQIGRVVEALKAKGLYDNSLIFFVSDHGDMLGDHSMWRKTYPYEGSAAIPFIVKLPKESACRAGRGTTIDLPVELRDVLPTCLDIVSVAQPAKMDGCSLLPLLKDDNPSWRRWIELEHAAIYWPENHWVALTNGHIKYIWLCAIGCEQLFDLDADPMEQHDLAADSRYAARLAELRQAMVDYLSVRGGEWVSGGKLVRHTKKQIYGANFPAR